MLSCDCDCWGRSQIPDLDYTEPELFSLPSPLPQWPQGRGFGSGAINLGELEVCKITNFERIWSFTQLLRNSESLTFYKPVGIPDGFFCLGHYCQPNNQPLRGYVLVARDIASKRRFAVGHVGLEAPALRNPINYTLIWNHDDHGCIWLPNPPAGYKAMGFVVTDKAEEPDLEEVRCVREDLTEICETSDLILTAYENLFQHPFEIWNTRPCKRGMLCRGVPVGTFFCRNRSSSDEEVTFGCLKNLDLTLHAMPNLDQIHAVIRHYGPTVFFHPDEVYLPSSVQWFFKNGALLYQKGKLKGQRINYEGSNLPSGGTNDGEYWIDLSSDDEARNWLKEGNLESAELYVHVKPAMGGTFTDLAMWVFCPFNGPATLKLGIADIAMKRIGQHVCDWEHFTLRVSNFTGELWSVYFSQHSGGEWINAYELEFIEGNKAIVYSSKCGHASFPHPGTYLQGSSKLGIGVRNDAARSESFVDSSTRYQVIAAEYLGDGVVKEPCWLQYMREWGPSIVYGSRSELEKILDLLPSFIQLSVENLVEMLPTALYGEEGPTGPKEKDNWLGDERA